jgi:hypothetical protein
MYASGQQGGHSEALGGVIVEEVRWCIVPLSPSISLSLVCSQRGSYSPVRAATCHAGIGRWVGALVLAAALVMWKGSQPARRS